MINLFQHQQQALDETEGKNRVAYYLDMGLGKTFVGSEKALKLNSRVNLLVCQCSKVQDWIEHMTENYAMNHCWMIYDMTKKNEFDWFMKAAMEVDNPDRICGVINYELTFRRNVLKTLTGFTLMLDESSLIQNENAKRSKFILGLKPDNVILLSGTPTGGKYENLWSQCQLLGWKISKELFWKQYIQTEWVETDGFWRQQITGYKNVDRLKLKLAEHGAVFMTTEQAGISLPKRNWIKVKTRPSPLYWKFWNDRYVAIDSANLGEFELDADFYGSNAHCERELIGDTSLTRRLYARQLCGLYNPARYEAFRDLVNSTEDRLIVFYNFTEEMERLNGIAKGLNRPVSVLSGEEKNLDAYRYQHNSIGENGQLQVVTNLPNNRLIDNQYALMVDQKTNYLVGKPFTLNCQDKGYTDALGKVFNKRFYRLLKYVCEDALNGGIGWLYPYYNEAGELTFKHFPAYDILPFWADDDHTILDCAIRYYTQEVWNGYQKEKVEKVEIFKADGIYRYIYQNDMLIADVEAGEHENYFMVEEEGQEPKWFNWTRIPLVPFKYNKQEIPLIRRVKTLQDGINTMISDFENNMQEDARNTILVLKNYDGENLGEFRHNLSTYGAVKVREDGGVETLQVEINAENYKGILELLKKSLIENARGYDAKDDRLSGNPNQMNIQSMYSDIDLDANGMETEFQAAFEELLWFINQDFSNRGLGDYEGAELQIVFNRDILINETESIENCSKSVGILSTETIVEQHPWVTDVEVELARLRKEKDEAMEQAQEYAGAFQTGNPNQGDNGGGE